jgi:hypothetical protein
MYEIRTKPLSQLRSSLDSDAEFFENFGVFIFEPLVGLEVKGHRTLEADHLSAIVALLATKTSFVRIVVLINDSFDFV